MAQGVELRMDIRAKRFDRAPQPLFEGLRVDVPAGEVLALIGPSGIGKSTLLRMIAGIDRDFDGRIEVAGIPAAQAPAPGFVFQDPRLLPWLDVIGNIRAVRPDVTDGEARDLLCDMELDGQGQTMPSDLSGGMQRRVALARALATGPGLLLLDEPFVSTDHRLAAELRQVVARSIARHGPTTILVSHEPRDAAHLADRVIRIEGRPARIVQDERITPSRDARSPGDIARISARLEDPRQPRD